MSLALTSLTEEWVRSPIVLTNNLNYFVVVAT